MTTIIPVLLAGGSGTRLWPMSSRQKPKQFHKIAGDITLFQQTILRVRGKVGDVSFADPIIVSNEQFAGLIAEQLREIDVEAEAVILEPVGRNTAPAVASAALHAAEKCPDALLLFLPADHVIVDVDDFKATIARGSKTAAAGRLVTFGITPRVPETGYGYILRGDSTGEGFEVAGFVEKPDLKTAQQYLAHGGYYWNAGIFLFPIQVVLQELAHHEPALLAGVREALDKSDRTKSGMTLDAAIFGAITPISVDYALMEKVKGAVVVPMDAGWNDIGSWSALSEMGVHLDTSKLLLHKSQGAFALSSGPNVAIIGVPDIVVIATAEGTLVVDKKLAQDVKLAYSHFEGS